MGRAMTASTLKPFPANLLSNNDAASYLGVSPNLLRLSRHTGELFKGAPAPPYVKFGHAVRYRKQTLDGWLDKLEEFGNSADYSAKQLAK